MSDLLQKTEKLIEEAKVLLVKVQAGIDESDALMRTAGIDDIDAQLARTKAQALPADVVRAEQWAADQVQAIEHQRAHPPALAAVSLSEPAGSAPRRRKFRPMV